MCKKKNLRKSFGRKFLIIPKSFSRKHVCKKEFWEKFCEKDFLVEIFYGCKIISSNTGLQGKMFEKNILCKFFIVAKSFIGKHVWRQNFLRQMFGRQFFMVAKHFLQNRFENKKFKEKFF